MSTARVSTRRTGLRILSSVFATYSALCVPALVSVVAATVTAPAVIAQGTQGLLKVGPLNPVTGLPQWYQDKNGLILEVCSDLNSCFFAPPNPEAPVHFPDNFPDEMFWWAANGLMTGATPGDRALLVIALEGVFANGTFNGDQASFARVRIRVDGLTDGETYTVTHPYGVETFVAEAGGINMTRDIGLNIGTFDGALKGDIGPFLVPTGFVTPTPGNSRAGTFIADGATEVTVQGSPFGTNYFQIQGPGVGAVYPANAIDANTVRLSNLVIQGRVAQHVSAEVTSTYYSRSATSTSTNVWASSASGQTLRAEVRTASGTWGTSVPMTENGTSGTYFVRLEMGESERPAQLRVTNLSDNPPTSFLYPPNNSSGVPSDLISDLVTVESAVYDLSNTTGTALTVIARSSDSFTPPASLTTILPNTDGTIDAGPLYLAHDGAGVFSGSRGLLPTAPRVVTVQSINGYSVTAPVRVIGTGAVAFVAPDPVAAQAGPDQSGILTNTTVQLNGGDSTGPVNSYTWSPSVGTGWALSNPNIANPTFVTPAFLPGGSLDLTFTLTVRNVTTGGTVLSVSSDSVVVHVSQPAQQPADVLTFTDARYIASKQKWRVTGQSTVFANQRIDLFLGTISGPDFTRPIGSAFVDATGLWDYQGGNNSANQNVRPPIATYTLVYARSGFVNPGVGASSTFRIN